MFTLYLDNFRNFYDSYIDIRNINFLVGENSTGKSSLLELINLLSEQRFWFHFKFFNQFIDLRLFRDFTIEEKSNYFRIGFCKEKHNNVLKHQKIAELEDEIPGMMLSFKNQEGIPEIDQINIIYDNIYLKTKFDDNRTYYKIVAFDGKQKTIKNKFERMLIDEGEDFKEFQYKSHEYDILSGMRNEMFLIYGIMSKYYKDNK